MISALEANQPALAAAICDRWNTPDYSMDELRYFCFGIGLTLIKYDHEASDEALILYDLCRIRKSLH